MTDGPPDLLRAIKAHPSGDSDAQYGEWDGDGLLSEAKTVIDRFFKLNKNDQQAILNFFRSL